MTSRYIDSRDGVERIYVISTPCQGKSTFVRTHAGRYGRFRLVDLDNDVIRGFPAYYSRLAIEQQFFVRAMLGITFLRASTTPTIVFGNAGPDEPADYPDIRFIGLMIGPDQLRRQIDERARTAPHKLWTDWPEALRYYQLVAGHLERHAIPTYDSMSRLLAALDGAR